MLLLGVPTGSGPQASQQLTPDVEIDPAAAVFVYDDIDNFLRATRLIASGGDRGVTLRTEYLGKATPGLKMSAFWRFRCAKGWPPTSPR